MKLKTSNIYLCIQIKILFFLVLFFTPFLRNYAQIGTLRGTGMSICNIYSFSICPTQTITPFNYGNQGYACNGTTQPDVSFNIQGGGWRVNKSNWNFTASTNGLVSGYTNSGTFQSFPFLSTNTITPLNYSGSFIQFAINGVATGPLLSQANFSISLSPIVFGSNSYTFCASTATSIAISPITPATGGPWNYNWQPGNISGNPINVSPSINTIYTVTANSSAGCASATTVAVTATCISSSQSCGGSVLFTGNSDAVDLPLNNQMYGSNGFTWECWFKLNTPFTSSARTLICNVDAVVYEDIFLGFGWNYGVGNFPANHLGFKVDGPNATTGPSNVSCDYMPPGGFVIGSWYHVSGVMDYTNHTAKLYLNGVLVDTKTVNSDPISRNIPGTLSQNSGIALGGNEDEVRIWNRVRTASEIAADYNQCLTGNENNLLMYYRCDQLSGSIVTDATTNGINGNFVNLTSWSSQQPSVSGLACTSGINLLTSSSPTICAGSNATLTATGATSYTWSNAATLSSSTGSTVIASPNVTTNYTITGANAACTNTAIVTVSVNPSPTITATAVNNTSCGLSNGSATVTSLPSNNTYTWSSGVSSTTNTASNLATGNYTITANNGACQTNTVISIIGSVPLSIISSTVLPSNCNLNDGSISITDNMIGSNYSWSPNVSVTNNAAGLPTGNYALTIINGACTTSTIFNVGSTGGPTGFISITAPSCDSDDGSIVIDSIKGGFKPYSMNFNNNGLTSNMVFENLSTGNYSLSIQDSSLCETEYLLTVPSNNTDFTLYIPNTFTPNNDKVNDIWYIKGTCLDKMNCLIYNRWGEKIKELKDINEGWDGTYKGASVPDGVYVYLIEVTTKEGTINKAGHITVFR